MATKECYACNGSGKTTCPRCDGTGIKPYAVAIFQVAVDCGMCYGTGNVDCEECDGSGFVEDYD